MSFMCMLIRYTRLGILTAPIPSFMVKFRVEYLMTVYMLQSCLHFWVLESFASDFVIRRGSSWL